MAKSKEVSAAMPEVDSLGFIKFLPLFLLGLTIPRAIGGAIALAIYKFGKTALYDKNMAGLGLAESENGYLYAAAAVFGFLVSWLNNYPVLYKNMVMRFSSGNLRANMMIFKEDGKEGAPYVVLETEGPVGSYNRANRSLTHFTENTPSLALCIILAGSVFPLPTLTLTATFGFGRILHQIGYASVGYGGHGLGFAIALVSTVTLEMLCLFVAGNAEPVRLAQYLHLSEAKSTGIGMGPIEMAMAKMEL
ncbi:unnamed protein product [Polarella glacialis]|uniref:MAPEG family protein n=1 Tax=Polarella glacialis TaxID=89957 RepID=A0A813L257_POLGL|nr:unnamed protein product [Polarella glacialis]